ncbi:MAG: DUF389 domain-containing protein [Armatimonadota bacterium]
MPDEELQRVEFKGDVDLTFDNLAFVILSSILASAALLAGSMPVLIGSMILAPTFDPLVAVPFALVNRDWTLARRGLVNSLIMFAIVLLFCLATVWFITGVLDLYTRQGIVGVEMITERLNVTWASVIVSLTAGAGGAIAFASERRANLVGVVVALALVPSLAAAAIGFLASPLPGWGGIALFGINYGGIVVSGYLVLLLRVATGRAEQRKEKGK